MAKGKGTVLFNEKCSICNYEIQHYKKRSNLQYTDCSNMDDKYLKALHVKLEDGRELEGVKAFIYVWKNTNGYNWLGTLVSFPVIFYIAKYIYAVMAKLLYWRYIFFTKTK